MDRKLIQEFAVKLISSTNMECITLDDLEILISTIASDVLKDVKNCSTDTSLEYILHHDSYNSIMKKYSR